MFGIIVNGFGTIHKEFSFLHHSINSKRHRNRSIFECKLFELFLRLFDLQIQRCLALLKKNVHFTAEDYVKFLRDITFKKTHK